MARALRLAERGVYTTQPNPRVGCVVVAGGEIVGEGAHLRAGQAHAEVHALQMAGASARGADLFVTLEPCSHHGRTPPCADAVVAAGPRTVWVAMADPNPLVAGAGIERLRAAGIEVELGLLGAEAAQLNRGYLSRITRGRPWLSLKLAASLDGRTAMASGESQWITAAPARADVHRLRAAAGSVMTGVATILADDPQLSARDQGFAVRQPDRIVVDTRARVPLTARVWGGEEARRYWIVGERPAAAPDGVDVLHVARAADGAIDLPAVLDALAARGVNEILLECGPRLAGAFLLQGLVDEVVAYLAPTLLGHEARPFAWLPGLERLAQRLEFEFVDTRRVGADLRLQLRPRRREER